MTIANDTFLVLITGLCMKSSDAKPFAMVCLLIYLFINFIFSPPPTGLL